jgi:formylglycine-generating enzyme required for sulfatase activity
MVFLSYAKPDADLAEVVCKGLEAGGHKCWMAPRDIQLGLEWSAAITMAIRQSQVFVLVYTGHSNLSKHIINELEQAARAGVTIIPFRVEPIEANPALAYYLDARQWFEAYPGKLEQHVLALSERIRRYLGAETETPEKIIRTAPMVGSDAGTISSVGSDRPARDLADSQTKSATHLSIPVAASGRAESVGHERSTKAGQKQKWVVAAVAGGLFALLGVGFLLALQRNRTRPDVGITNGQPTTALSSPPIVVPTGTLTPRVVVVPGKSSEPSAEPASYSSTPPKLLNKAGMQMVLIKAGKFQMGNPYAESRGMRDETLHTVEITVPFYISDRETTVKQFADFVADVGYRTDAERMGGTGTLVNRSSLDPAINWKWPGFKQGSDHPVVCISWNDANAFCRWLSDREKRKYRLPTEAEWEYAARAGTRTTYFWGDQPEEGEGYINAADAKAKAVFPKWTTFDFDDGYVNTAPVGSFKPNNWGLYDMLGNASEWVNDRYAPYTADRLKDPLGPSEGEKRIIRGGSWNSYPSYSRSAYRLGMFPTDHYDFTGFRVVSDVETR